MTKRISCGIAALVMIVLLSACSSKEYEHMSAVSDSETAAITRGDETYLFHGFVNGGKLAGGRSAFPTATKTARYIW